MQLMLIGLNGLLLFCLWTFALKKTILDTHRDHLFDLRDSIRATFVAEGWDLNSPIYKRLRDLINRYLRFTENYSLWEVVHMNKEVSKRPNLQVYMKTKIETEFAVADTSQQAFVRQMRAEALSVIVNYMILSSGPLVILMIVAMPFFLCRTLLKACMGALRAGGVSFFGKVSEFYGVFHALGKYILAFIGSFLWAEDFVEEYSYKCA